MTESTYRPARGVHVGIFVSVLTAILATVANGLIGWVTNTYDWHVTTFVFTNGLMVLSWLTVVSLAHLESVRHEQARSRALVRAELISFRQSVRDTIRDQQLAARGTQRVEQADRYLHAIDNSERR